MVFLAALCFLSGMLLYRQMNLSPNCFFATGILVVSLGLIHTYRTDKAFVYLTGANARQVFALEYLVFSLPVLLVVFASTYWYCGMILIAACYGVPFLPFDRWTRKTRFSRVWLVPADNFEWISGMRKNKVYLLLLYGGALILAYYPYGSLIPLWLMLGVVSSFYTECEPREMLENYALPPAPFIRMKMLAHLKLYFWLSCPLMVVSVAFHPGTLWIVMAMYALSFINLSFFILSKYAIYSPSENRSSNSLLVVLVHLSMWVPFLVPLPLLMGWRAYKKALVNLETYLYAYH